MGLPTLVTLWVLDCHGGSNPSAEAPVMNVEEIPAFLQERLRLQERFQQLRRQLFPQRVRLELDDQFIRATLFPQGKQAVGEVVQVPLPVGICRKGAPQNVAALGDFIGDWFFELGVVEPQLEAVLPLAACQWRLVEWPFEEYPDAPLMALRQLRPDLFGDAVCLGSEPLEGMPLRSLVWAAPQSLLGTWQEVFSAAGADLKRLIPPQAFAWKAYGQSTAGEEHWHLGLDPSQSRLWLVVDGVPQADWPMPGWTAGAPLDDQWGQSLGRCKQFWQQQAAQALPQRWWLYGPGCDDPTLQAMLQESVDPWPLALAQRESLPWNGCPVGLDLLAESRSEQDQALAAGVDWRGPLQRGAWVGGALLASAVLAVGGLAAVNGTNRQEIERLLPAQAQADVFQVQLQRQRRQLRALEASNQALAEGLVAVASGSALLEELRRCTPAGVQFTNVTVEPDLLRLKGTTMDPQAFARVNALQLKLQGSSLFQSEGVQLIRASRDGASGTTPAGSLQPVAFELTALFASPPSRLDASQLRALGANGMAQRLVMLQQAGVLP